ncbi:MAG: SMP-30/gluconolactonase/LRE family protein, partial [Atopobiaceae bacterium]|nr:SMP-30/gluconolactonase/LRE family protein [Atopobiaceae bacterium]
AIAYSTRGSMVAVLSPEGELVETFLEGSEQTIDDLVFDSDGGFYFTDLSGTPQNQSAGVFYCEPDHRTVHTLVSGMIESNGIALTPDGKGLWVTEYGKNRLWYLKVPKDKVSFQASSTRIPYKFTGTASSDSCCVDCEGNVYVALCGQGRYMVFNPLGMPIGQVLMPGREHGAWMRTTHPMLRPGTDELYMTGADYTTGKSAIFVARGFAKAHDGMFQFQ